MKKVSGLPIEFGTCSKAWRRFMAGLTGAAMILAVGTPALAAGNAEAGRRLAQHWCVSCHIVSPEGPGTDAAPPFSTIAKQTSQEDRGWLRAWLTAPHPPMPDLHLSRQEIDDIMAYLDSLR